MMSPIGDEHEGALYSEVNIKKNTSVTSVAPHVEMAPRSQRSATLQTGLVPQQWVWSEPRRSWRVLNSWSSEDGLFVR